MPLDFVKTEKGNSLLNVDGFLFWEENKSKAARKLIIWRCNKYRKLSCPARIHTDSSNIVTRLNEHNHAPDLAAVEARKTIERMKERAQNTRESTQTVMIGELSEVSNAVAPKLPAVPSMKRTIRRVREHEHDFKEPENRADLIIPEKLQKTLTGERFLLFDSGKHEDRIIIFASAHSLNQLIIHRSWYMDGTFRSCPSLFGQVFTIHIIDKLISIQMVYALLPNKQQNTYNRLFRALIEAKDQLNPNKILTDFELAILNAIDETFPGVDKKGCFYHFSQSNFRKIQELGLVVRYREDPEFALNCRMFTALAFIPPDLVVETFEMLEDAQILPPEADDFLLYLEDNYIGRRARRGRRLARFSINLWNMYDHVLENLPRTNNGTEGWHNGFNQFVGIKHPNIFSFFEKIQLEENKDRITQEQLLALTFQPKQAKKYRDLDSKIQEIVKNFHEMDRINYLRALAHNFNY
jgi:hypothetical protein